MTMLPNCTLCSNKSDPRCYLMTKNGDVYPLCDGCSPHDADDARELAERCRQSGCTPLKTYGPFGHNEDD
jgi:hypothetical protein